MKLSIAVDAFLRSRRAAALAQSTVATYDRRLRELADWLGPRRLSEVSTDKVKVYVAHLHDGAGLRIIGDHVRVLKQFFGWLVEEGMKSENPAAALRIPRP